MKEKEADAKTSAAEKKEAQAAATQAKLDDFAARMKEREAALKKEVELAFQAAEEKKAVVIKKEKQTEGVQAIDPNGPLPAMPCAGSLMNGWFRDPREDDEKTPLWVIIGMESVLPDESLRGTVVDASAVQVDKGVAKVQLPGRLLTLQAADVEFTDKRPTPAKPASLASDNIASISKETKRKFVETVWQLSRRQVNGTRFKHRLEMSETDTLILEGVSFLLGPCGF